MEVVLKILPFLISYDKYLVLRDIFILRTPRIYKSETCAAIRTLSEETFVVYNRFFGVPTRRFWRVELPKYYTYLPVTAHTSHEHLPRHPIPRFR